jgi:hypothetical protein
LAFLGVLEDLGLDSSASGPSCPPSFKPFRNCDTSLESVGWENIW